MAELAGLAAGAALGVLAQEIVNQLKLVYSCQEECEKLKDTSKRIPKIFKVKCEDPDEWLSRFQSLLNDAEGIVQKCKKPCYPIGRLYTRYKYASKILKLAHDIDFEIRIAVPLESLDKIGELRSLILRENAYIFQDQDVPKMVLGMEDRFKKIKETIIEKSKRTMDSNYIGIRGQGGCGKTLLAKKLNNDEDIHGAFGKDLILWITVGHDAVIPDKYKIMRRFLGIPETSAGGKNLTDQRTQVVDEFSKRRVLLILDDVWDTPYCDQKTHVSEQMMDRLDVAHKGAGSVTLVTTRELGVFRELINAKVEEMQLLSNNDSWDLFHSHAFPEGSLWLGKELEVVAEKVCKECGRLPLALKVVGSAMRDETTIEDWRFALDRLKESRSLPGCSTNETQLYGRLQTSYDRLNVVLQKCFLYFAALAEDAEILAEDLYKVWMSEEVFGEGIDEKDARAEARSSLKLLSMRSLLEVRHENEDNQCLKYFHMHDCLRDVATSIFRGFEESARPFKPVKDSGFMYADEKCLTNLKVKRMSLIFNWRKSCDLDHERTCMLESHVKARIGSMGTDFFLSLGKLRYLEMSGMRGLEELPESITRLKFLRFLDLSSCKALKQLLQSIGDLRSLRHLNLGSCGALEELPKTIGDLQSLEYLHLFECRALRKLPDTVTNLQSLQILDVRDCGAFRWPTTVLRCF